MFIASKGLSLSNQMMYLNKPAAASPPVPPASSLVWYLKMNSDAYYAEAQSGEVATKEGTITDYDANGKYGGYCKFAQGACLIFSGDEKANAFRLDLRSNWSISFHFKPSSSTAGYVVMCWSDLGYQIGDNIGIGIWYNGAQSKWQVEIYSKSGGVEKLTWEAGLVAAPPANDVWTLIRVSYNAEANKIRFARNDAVFEVKADKDPSLFPNLTEFGPINAPYFKILSSSGENSLDNIACHSEDLINDDTTNVEPTEEYT